jgi:hypothetical protein
VVRLGHRFEEIHHRLAKRETQPRELCISVAVRGTTPAARGVGCVTGTATYFVSLEHTNQAGGAQQPQQPQHPASGQALQVAEDNRGQRRDHQREVETVEGVGEVYPRAVAMVACTVNSHSVNRGTGIDASMQVVHAASSLDVRSLTSGRCS